MTRKTDTLYVNALAKGLQVLRAFDEANSEMSLSQIAARTGLDKSAVQRLANTLHLEGCLEKDSGTRRFRPSHAWLELAYAYYWSDPLVPQAMPKLIELSQQIGETINMAELSGEHIIYVSRLPTKRSYFAATIIGRKLPALSTSAGRAILSTWPEAEWRAAVADWPLKSFTPRTTLDRDEIADSIARIAQDGYAISCNQMILNEIGLAAPIWGPDGRARAAVQCSVSSYRWDEDMLREKVLPVLLETANAISPMGQG